MLPSKKSFFRDDFSGQSFVGEDLSHREFICCNFNKADLTDADCTGSVFTGATLRGTKCTRTNFRNATLACFFYPSDAMGMTLTLSCRTFTGMSISTLWWYGFLFCAMLMKPEFSADNKDPRDMIISLMGAKTYLKLKGLFSVRQI